MCFKAHQFSGHGNGVLIAALLLLAVPFLSSCMDERAEEGSVPVEVQAPSLFGEGGILGSMQDEPVTSIGVNSFLWRASLDAISFMPVTSADPFGGVIITDWYSPSETPNERFKLNVYILGRALRADGIRVAVFHQLQSGNDWRDIAIESKVGTKVEDAILTRARQLRHETMRQ
ncbi:MAG TPA: DUF3576 domain-containing protein [Rhodospirillales bacterium]|nr:DUF3576 domain-containing protein [Rhodospirillales bacterium]